MHGFTESNLPPEQREIGELLGLREQWAKQVRVLTDAGIVDFLPNSHKYGIVGGDGKEYALPSVDAIEQAMKSHERVVREKVAQGFEHLILVPQGVPLLALIDHYHQRLLAHTQQKTVFFTDGTPLQFDEIKPVWALNYYNGKDGHGADATGEMEYFPTSFDIQTQSTITTQELLDEQQAWQILLVEKTIDIPAVGKGVVVGGRPQLEVGESPREYLRILQTNPYYKNEYGLTPQGWIALALTQLEETDQQIDDFGGSGKGCFLLGGLLNGNVCTAAWYRIYKRALLYMQHSGYQDSNFGIRTAVNVSMLNL